MFLFLLMCEEWGDKSQFAAIALAANYGVIPIIIGGCLVSLSTLIQIGTCLLYLNRYDAWSHSGEAHQREMDQLDGRYSVPVVWSLRASI